MLNVMNRCLRTPEWGFLIPQGHEYFLRKSIESQIIDVIAVLGDEAVVVTLLPIEAKSWWSFADIRLGVLGPGRVKC